MPHGAIEGFSEVVQWKIPDFFCLNKVKNECIESPQFSSVGCTWHLRVYPKGNGRVDGWMSVFLRLDDDTTTKTVTYIIGMKLSDGKIEEVGLDFNRMFRGGTSLGWKKFFDLEDLQERKSELAPSDALTVTCRIERETPTPENIALNHQELDSRSSTFIELEDLSSDFQDLLRSEKACDFTVNVQGKKFRVHRSVLAARSPVFGAMFEHDTEEAKSGVLNIPDCHPESFQEFINFLYTGKIEEVTFETAYHLYSTAEKYDVQRLKSLCANYLRLNLSVDNVCEVIILSDQFSDDQLHSSVQDFFNENSMQILLRPEWEEMMKANYRLASKVLKGMASASLIELLKQAEKQHR